MAAKDPPAEVASITRAIREFLSQTDEESRRIGSARCGIYAFYDYDAEPIYVGQTVEGLSGRISRHLTGRRSDAVGKFVLDPFEVLEIEVWPMFEASALEKDEMKRVVNEAEYTVFQKALAASQFGAVLNEGVITPTSPTILPKSYRGRIVPSELYEERCHPDVRIARRAQTIASLARLISERKVGKGLRTTLLVQSQRLEALARSRFQVFAGDPDDVEAEG